MGGGCALTVVALVVILRCVVVVVPRVVWSSPMIVVVANFCKLLSPSCKQRAAGWLSASINNPTHFRATSE